MIARFPIARFLARLLSRRPGTPPSRILPQSEADRRLLAESRRARAARLAQAGEAAR